LTDFRIRRARADDAAACAAIYAPFVTDTWISFETQPPSAGEMLKRISAWGGTYGWLVAVRGMAVIGYAYGSPHRSRDAYSSSCDVAVYVDPSMARRGVGTALYSALLPMLKDRYHAAFAGISLPNDPSIALHKSFGFEQVGVYKEVGWKLEDWRDVSWWQLLL
tara:strand:+ start:33775 stop:34266 length:492 start_codon:yes stop_codon:yes gene_type:complete